MALILAKISFQRVPLGQAAEDIESCHICNQGIPPGHLILDLSCCGVTYHGECISLWINANNAVCRQCTKCRSSFSSNHFNTMMAQIACGLVNVNPELAIPDVRRIIQNPIESTRLGQERHDAQANLQAYHDNGWGAHTIRPRDLVQGGVQEYDDLQYEVMQEYEHESDYAYDANKDDEVVGDAMDNDENYNFNIDGPTPVGGVQANGGAVVKADLDEVDLYDRVHGFGRRLVDIRDDGMAARSGIFVYEDETAGSTAANYPPNVHVNANAIVLRPIVLPIRIASPAASEASTDIEIAPTAAALADPSLRGGLHVTEPTGPARRLGAGFGHARQNSSADGSNRENEDPNVMCMPVTERIAMETERLYRVRMAALARLGEHEDQV